MKYRAADKDEVPLNSAGGSAVLEAYKNWYGAGHNAVAGFNGTGYLIYAADNGRCKLRIEKYSGSPLAHNCAGGYDKKLNIS